MRKSTPSATRRTPIATPTLQQFRLDDDRGSASTSSSDIEVCVESVLLPDTEDMCCDMLQRRLLKRKYFSTWKFRQASQSAYPLNSTELRGVREQANRNASGEARRMRTKFLSQFGKLAALSISKLQLSRVFSRWVSAFAARRLAQTQASVGVRLGDRRLTERSLHRMRTALLRHVEDKLGETERDASQIKTGDRLRELVDELRRSEARNADLETQIEMKGVELSDLQMELRNAIQEGHDAEKRLRELQTATAELQKTFSVTEQEYQDEIAALRARLSLESSEQGERLSQMEEALRRQSAERKAAYAFADDAQMSAMKEIEDQEERLASAQKVVKSLQELLESSRERGTELERTRETMAEEVNALRMKRRQLESTISTDSIMANDREMKMRKMLQEAKAQLEASNIRIDGQSGQIRSKQREIELLEQEIAAEKRQMRSVQDKFLRNVSPKGVNRRVFDSF